MSETTRPKKECPECRRFMSVKKDGTLYAHTCEPVPAEASPSDTSMHDLTMQAIDALNRRTPEQKAETAARMDARVSGLLGLPRYVPPAFPASASYHSECSTCDGAIFEGDKIRSDGKGGWECAGHYAYGAEEDQGQDCKSCGHWTFNGSGYCDDCSTETTCDHTFTWGDDGKGHSGSFCTGCGIEDSGELKAARFAEAQEVVHVDCLDCGTNAAQSAPADPWSDPTSFADAAPAGPLKRKRTDQRTGHRVKDPRTGDFRRWKNGNVRGFTRVTTFIKAASDRTALTDWNERNVIIGAAKKPDIALRALSEDSESKEGKQALNALVDLVKEAAGAKDAANFGTDVHNSVERVVTGKCTIASLPETHRGWVQAYVDALEEHGLGVVYDLVERSVFCPEFGGVVGSFDQVVEEIATGKYFIADVKTGARMDYAWQEIEAQLALYVCGYSMYGTYVWEQLESEMDTERWAPPTVTLDATEGIVFHLPARGGGEPHCDVLRADLKRGWEHAKLCATVREAASGRPKPEAWSGSTHEPLHTPDTWEALFSVAISREQLSALYTQAAGKVDRMELDRLVRIGQQRLREIGA